MLFALREQCLIKATSTSFIAFLQFIALALSLKHIKNKKASAINTGFTISKSISSTKTQRVLVISDMLATAEVPIKMIARCRILIFTTVSVTTKIIAHCLDQAS